MKNATEAPIPRQPAKHRPKQLELRVMASNELHAEVVGHLEAMRKRDPLRGYVLADAVRELVIRGLVTSGNGADDDGNRFDRYAEIQRVTRFINAGAEKHCASRIAPDFTDTDAIDTLLHCWFTRPGR